MSSRYYTARVHDNADPEQRGRLMLEIPELLDLEDEDAIWPEWVDPRIPGGAGPGAVGLFWIPPVDAIVVVERERGEGLAPLLRWSGGTLGNKGTLPSFLAGNYPARAGFSSPTGTSLIALDDGSGAFLLVDAEDKNISTKSYLAIKRDGSLQLGTYDGTTILADKRKIALLTSADGGADSNHLLSLDEETNQIALVHKDGTELIILDPGVLKLNATALQMGAGTIELTDGTSPGLNPYLLTLAFFADLALAVTDILAINAAIPGGVPVPVTPGLTALAANIPTSLATGAPYLSTITSGN